MYTLLDRPPGHTVAKSGCFKVSAAACVLLGNPALDGLLSVCPTTQAWVPGFPLSLSHSFRLGGC